MIPAAVPPLRLRFRPRQTNQHNIRTTECLICRGPVVCSAPWAVASSPGSCVRNNVRSPGRQTKAGAVPSVLPAPVV
jgi:hypothetical protein